MAAGKSYRKGIDVMEMADMFATEDKARRLFEDWLWGGERCCVRCGSENTYECQPQDDAVSVPRLWPLFQRPHRHGDGAQQGSATQVGLGDLP